MQSGAKTGPQKAEHPATSGKLSPAENSAGGSTIGRVRPAGSEPRPAQPRVGQPAAIPAGLASRKPQSVTPAAQSPAQPESKQILAAIPLAAAATVWPTPAQAAIPAGQTVIPAGKAAIPAGQAGASTTNSRWRMSLLVGGVALAFVGGIVVTVAIFHHPAPDPTAMAVASTDVGRTTVDQNVLPAVDSEKSPAAAINQPPVAEVIAPVAGQGAVDSLAVEARKPAATMADRAKPPAPPVVPSVDRVPLPAVVVPPAAVAPVAVVAPDNRVDDPLQNVDPLAHPRVNPPKPPVEKPGIAGTVKVEIKRTPPRKVDVEARLEDSLAEMELHKLSLDRFASTFGQLTTANVTLDAQSLEELGLTPAAAVSVTVRDATIGKTMQTALAPLGLACVVRDGQLLIQRQTDAPRNVRYSVADLVADDPQSKVEFVTLLTSSVSPESWRAAGGNGDLKWLGQQLAIDQSPAVHYQLLVFCEKLRVARGIAPRSKFDPMRFKLVTHHARVAAALQQSVTANFIAPRPLAEIVDYLQANGHVNIVVDWLSLSREELAPETTLALRIGKATVEEALTSLASALDLAVVCVDDTTVQLTTRKAAARLQVEFYPLADIVTDQLTGDLLAKRASDRVSALRDPQAGLRGVVLYDPAGKCLVVAQPQATQIEIEKAVEGWRQRKLEVSRR